MIHFEYELFLYREQQQCSHSSNGIEFSVYVKRRIFIVAMCVLWGCLPVSKEGGLVWVDLDMFKAITCAKLVESEKSFHKHSSSENPLDICCINIKLLPTTNWQQMPVTGSLLALHLLCPSALVGNLSSLILHSVLCSLFSSHLLWNFFR